MAVQRHLQPTLGAEIGIGVPAHIGQQTGRLADSLMRLVREQRRDPVVEQVAMFGEATEQPPLLASRDDQRVRARVSASSPAWSSPSRRP